MVGVFIDADNGLVKGEIERGGNFGVRAAPLPLRACGIFSMDFIVGNDEGIRSLSLLSVSVDCVEAVVGVGDGPGVCIGDGDEVKGENDGGGNEN